ncbi:arsenate reductase/protein-tyrosine-phosphatase family protein [Geomonas agri]|uniref:arsenate reductase/protein-tyrosine-phosphatase family protein n=1 Tax=Geomonas agri TaxID=2873702 RepID=UPI001CD6D1CD|nr:hypothetical protein [Geomonas agri]
MKKVISRSRSIVKKLAARIHLASARVDTLKNIDGSRVGRLVFVCFGNVCRSPYAEVAAQTQGISATSCGVAVRRSAPAELTAVEAALLRGIDLTKHRSRSIYQVELNPSDCLVVMAPSQLTVALAVAAENGCQVTLIGLWCDPAIAEIADPYGRPLEEFRQCFDDIDRALAGFLRVIGKHI